MGFYYHLLEKHDSAYYYYYQSNKQYKALNEIKTQAEVLYNMAYIQEIEGDYVGCETNAIASISLIEQLPETESNLITLWDSNNIIAIVSAELEDYDRALEYYNKFNDYRNELNNPQLTNGYLMGVGEVYFEKGLYDEALSYYQEALSSNEIITLRADNLIKLGLVEFKKENTIMKKYIDIVYFYFLYSRRP